MKIETGIRLIFQLKLPTSWKHRYLWVACDMLSCKIKSIHRNFDFKANFMRLLIAIVSYYKIYIFTFE